MYERAGGDEPVFVFKHALTQDVAYDSLLSRRRRELHLEAARALEELYSDRLDELTATLAYHYARTDLIDESVTWLVRAAERAARVYANAEAILHLDLAARRLQRLPEGAGPRSPHARRGASACALAVFPGPLPRERRRAASSRRQAVAARRCGPERRVFVLARAHVQPPRRSAPRRRQRRAGDRGGHRRRRSRDARQGPRPARARGSLVGTDERRHRARHQGRQAAEAPKRSALVAGDDALLPGDESPADRRRFDAALEEAARADAGRQGDRRSAAADLRRLHGRLGGGVPRPERRGDRRLPRARSSRRPIGSAAPTHR